MLVFSDMTEKDITIIAGLLGELEARQNDKLAELNVKLDEKLAEQNANLDVILAELTNVIKAGFQDLHFFSRRRVEVLQKVTSKLYLDSSLSIPSSSTQIGTGHVLLF